MRDEKKAIVLLAHGSPLPDAKKAIVSLAKKLSRYIRVKMYYAFLQFNHPRLIKCLYNIVGNKKLKVSEVMILPVFISDGNHTLSDLPKIIKTFKKTYKHINIKLAKPLGNDDLVVRLLYKRYKEQSQRNN